MKKRTFLKLSAAVASGPLLAPLTAWASDDKLRNWAGNYTYGTNRLHEAASAEQVREFVRKTDHLKVLGSRHCFNGIADSTHQLLHLRGLDRLVSLDAGAKTVTVGSAMKYGQLAPLLHAKGFALPNLASLPHISIGGAIATGTHGSGVQNGNLATAVSALEFLTATGETVRLSRQKDGEALRAAAVHLGALGVVTQVTLDVEPTFQVRQNVYENLPLEELEASFDRILEGGYSVSLFTDWQKKNISEVWVKRRVAGDYKSAPAEYFGAKAATRNLHPIVELSAENCTPQMGVPGPWFERLPHFKMGFTPSTGKELQSEYFVPYREGMEAIRAIERLRDRITPHLFISEIRTIAADALWMSPHYRRPSLAIHFTWKPNWSAVRQVLPVIERELAPFGARPHWGKLFTTPPAQFAKLYERLPDFQKLVREYDPKGKFRNEFLRETILPA
jgi:xylitol oxidase